MIVQDFDFELEFSTFKIEILQTKDDRAAVLQSIIRRKSVKNIFAEF